MLGAARIVGITFLVSLRAVAENPTSADTQTDYGTALEAYARLAEVERNACGPEALYLAARAARWDVSLQQVLEATTMVADGCSLKDLYRAARACGLPAQLVTLDEAITALDDCSLVLHREHHFFALIRNSNGQPVPVDGQSDPGAWTPEMVSGVSSIGIKIIARADGRGKGYGERSCQLVTLTTLSVLGILGFLLTAFASYRGRRRRVSPERAEQATRRETFPPGKKEGR